VIIVSLGNVGLLDAFNKASIFLIIEINASVDTTFLVDSTFGWLAILSHFEFISKVHKIMTSESN